MPSLRYLKQYDMRLYSCNSKERLGGQSLSGLGGQGLGGLGGQSLGGLGGQGLGLGGMGAGGSRAEFQSPYFPTPFSAQVNLPLV